MFSLSLSQLGLLTAQLFAMSGVILLLFKGRAYFGLLPLAAFVGSNQYLQTILASTLYIRLGDGYLISPGSVVLFPAALFAVLLLYHQDGVPQARSLIVGIVVSNVTLTLFSYFSLLHIKAGDVANLLGVPDGLFQVDPRIFLAGTLILILDFVAVVAVFEVVNARLQALAPVVRLPLVLIVVLVFDSLAFSILAFGGHPAFFKVLVSQLVSKTLAGALYGLVLYGFLYRLDPRIRSIGVGAGSGALAILTYRERFEILRLQKEAQERAFEKERTQNRAALTTAEGRYRTLFETTTDGLLVIDPDTDTILEINPAFSLLSGYAESELIGRSPQGVGLFEPFEVESDATKSGAWETRLLSRAGDPLNVEIKLIRLGNGGAPPAEVLIVRDITKRKAAELVLRESRDKLQRRVEIRTRELAARNERLVASELRYRQLFESSLGLICTYRLDGTLLSVNPAAAEILEYEPSEMVGRQLVDFVTAETRERLSEALGQLETDRGVVYSGLLRLETKSGSCRALLYKARVIEQGTELPFVLGHGQDVTELKHAEAELRRSEARYRDLFENSHDLIQSVRPDGSFVLVNNAWQKTLGYSQREVSQLRLLDIVAAERRSDFRRFLFRLTEEGFGGLVETEFVAKDGQLILVEGSVESAPSANGAIRGIFRDVTERKALEKLKDRFIETVSHELRTPLASIYGALDLMASGKLMTLPEPIERFVSVALRNSKRLSWLINEILDFQKIEAGRLQLDLQMCDLASILDQAIEDNQAYADRYHVKLARSSPFPPSAVCVDRGWLLQVMTNLISNAVKHSPAEAEVSIALEPRLDRFRVSVTDRGPGIPAKFQDQVFQPFSQVQLDKKPDEGSSGLGLSIARMLVEQMHGELNFTSDGQDRGATFYFDLSTTQPPGQGVPAPSQSLGVDL